eukprot:403330708
MKQQSPDRNTNKSLVSSTSKSNIISHVRSRSGLKIQSEKEFPQITDYSETQCSEMSLDQQDSLMSFIGSYNQAYKNNLMPNEQNVISKNQQRIQHKTDRIFPQKMKWLKSNWRVEDIEIYLTMKYIQFRKYKYNIFVLQKSAIKIQHCGKKGIIHQERLHPIHKIVQSSKSVLKSKDQQRKIQEIKQSKIQSKQQPPTQTVNYTQQLNNKIEQSQIQAKVEYLDLSSPSPQRNQVQQLNQGSPLLILRQCENDQLQVIDEINQSIKNQTEQQKLNFQSIQNSNSKPLKRMTFHKKNQSVDMTKNKVVLQSQLQRRKLNTSLSEKSFKQQQDIPVEADIQETSFKVLKIQFPKKQQFEIKQTKINLPTARQSIMTQRLSNGTNSLPRFSSINDSQRDFISNTLINGSIEPQNYNQASKIQRNSRQNETTQSFTKNNRDQSNSSSTVRNNYFKNLTNKYLTKSKLRQKLTQQLESNSVFEHSGMISSKSSSQILHQPHRLNSATKQISDKFTNKTATIYDERQSLAAMSNFTDFLTTTEKESNNNTSRNIYNKYNKDRGQSIEIIERLQSFKRQNENSILDYDL